MPSGKVPGGERAGALPLTVTCELKSIYSLHLRAVYYKLARAHRNNTIRTCPEGHRPDTLPAVRTSHIACSSHIGVHHTPYNDVRNSMSSTGVCVCVLAHGLHWERGLRAKVQQRLAQRRFADESSIIMRCFAEETGRHCNA